MFSAKRLIDGSIRVSAQTLETAAYTLQGTILAATACHLKSQF
jgi:hypothetical protein